MADAVQDKIDRVMAIVEEYTNDPGIACRHIHCVEDLYEASRALG